MGSAVHLERNSRAVTGCVHAWAFALVHSAQEMAGGGVLCAVGLPGLLVAAELFEVTQAFVRWWRAYLHNLSDIPSVLLISMATALRWAARPADSRAHVWLPAGRVLAAITNAILLILRLALGLFYAAIERLPPSCCGSWQLD